MRNGTDTVTAGTPVARVEEPEADEPRPASLGQRVRQPQTLASFFFAVVIVVFLVRRLDINPAEVWTQLRSANPLLFGLGIAVFYAGFVLRTVRWRRMLVRAGVTSLPDVQLPSNPAILEIMLLAWFANCVVPAKLGDVYRGFLLKRRSRAPLTTSMGTIAAERLIDLVVLLVLLLASGVVVFGRHFPGDTETIVLYGGITVLVGLAVVAIVAVFRETLMGMVPDRFVEPVSRLQAGLFTNLRNPWSSVGFSIGIWLLDGVRVFFVAWSLGVVLPLSTALFIALVGALAAVSPVTPAGLGVVEAVLISVLTIVGVHGDTATAIAILERIISYWSLIVVGLPIYVLHVRRDVAPLAGAGPAPS